MIVGDQSELDEWGALMNAVGITHFETTWSGMKVLHDGDRSDERTVALLEVFIERLQEIESYKARDQFIDLVEKSLKAHIEKRAEWRKKILETAPKSEPLKPPAVVDPVQPKPVKWWRRLLD